MKRLFWACAGLSLGLHLALAIAWQPQPARAAAALNPARPPSPLQTRLVVLLPTSAVPAATVAPAAAMASTDLPPAGDPPEAATAEINAVAAGSAADTAIEHDPVSVAAAGWDDYLPRSLLSITPSPREAIALDYPADGPVVGRFLLTLTLYIDETGAVRRVDVASDEPVPDALRQAAQAAFAGRRFSPGELASGVVKSRIRIEALYESLALPKFAGNAAVGNAAVADAAVAGATERNTPTAH